MKQIILASESPQRKKLMNILGLPFKAVKSGFLEDMSLPLPPAKLVKALALGKAKAVAKKYPRSLIIAGDSVVEFKGEIMGKPRSAAEAKRMLRKISGQTVKIVSGLALFDSRQNKKMTLAVVSKVVFRIITKSEIDWYVKTGEPMDKAGAFAMQDKGSLFIKSISGDYFGAIGLPIFRLAQILSKFGVKVW